MHKKLRNQLLEYFGRERNFFDHKVEVLRRADHPPKGSYRSETVSFIEVGQGSNWGYSAKEKRKNLNGVLQVVANLISVLFSAAMCISWMVAWLCVFW
jgi:hypothetical protein